MKQICLIRGKAAESKPDFTRRILDRCRDLAGRPEVQALKVALTEPPKPRLSVIPFLPSNIAAISVYGALPEMGNPLEAEAGFSGAYAVEEALPVAYQKNWSDGEITPGVCLLTLFRRKPGISWEEFLDRWHNGHTPLTLKRHPIWHYSRNVVHQPLGEGAENWDGIVDEHFRKRSDLLNVYKFFGNSPLFPWHMWEVYADVQGFLEYRSVETYYTREYHLKS